MNKKKIIASILSVLLAASMLASCGNASTPGEKNADEIEKTPDSIGLVDSEAKSAEEVTAITAATDVNGKVVDSTGITDKSGHKVYYTGQIDSSGQKIYTTGKKASTGEILYTKNNTDTFGNLIYYTGKYNDKGKLELTSTDEAPDYTTNDKPTDKVILGTTTTTKTVGADIKSDVVITDANCSYAKYFGGSNSDSFRAIDVDQKNGGYVVAGISASTDGDLKGISTSWDGNHAVIVKYSDNGNTEWKYVVGGNGNVDLSDVAVLKDGTVVAVGFTSAADIDAPLNSKLLSAFIVKLDKNGSLMWMYSFPGDKNMIGEYLSSVAATPDGGFVAGGKASTNAGFFTGTQEKGSKAFLFKFDKNCNIKWRKILTGSKSNNFSGLAVASNGDIYALCATSSTDADFSAIRYSGSAALNTVLIKLNKNGDIQWSSYLEGSGNSEYNSVYVTADNGCIVAGSFTIRKKADGIYSMNYGESDGNVIRYTAEGDVRWAVVLGGQKNDHITGITEVDGGYAVVGYTESDTGIFQGEKLGGETDGFVLYLNEKGEVNTKVILDGSSSERVNSVCTLKDGTIAVCGFTKSDDNAFKGSGAAKQYKAFVASFKTETTKADKK